MKITAVVGSLRKDSYNKRLAEFIKENFKEKIDVEILMLNDIPMFNEDIEENPPVEVLNFKEKLKESDGVLFLTPEYNYSIPGGLKNAIDWCSRVDRVLAGKPTFIVGASSGNMATTSAQAELRKVLDTPGLGALLLPGNHVLIAKIQDKFDEDGNFNDENIIQRLDEVIDKFIDWSERIK